MSQSNWRNRLCGPFRHPGIRHGLTAGRPYVLLPMPEPSMVEEETNTND